MRAKPRHTHTYTQITHARTRTHARTHTQNTQNTHTHNTHTHTHTSQTHTHNTHARTHTRHARGAPRRRRRWTWRGSARTSSTRSCRPGQNILVKILVKATGQSNWSKQLVKATGQIRSEGQPAHLPRARAALPPTANRSKYWSKYWSKIRAREGRRADGRGRRDARVKTRQSRSIVVKKRAQYRSKNWSNAGGIPI